MSSRWRAALDPGSVTDDPSAMTTGELAAMLGVCHQQAWRRVRALVARGGAEVVTKTIKRAHGRPQRVTAYRLVKRKAA